MAARDKAKDDKQKAAKAKEKEKAARAQEKERAARAKEREKAARAKEKEKAAKAKEKERAARAKEKDKAAKAKEKERAAKAKEREKAAKAKERADKQKAKDRAAKDAAKQRKAEDRARRAEREQPVEDAPEPVEDTTIETAGTPDTAEPAETAEAPARPARRRRTARASAPALEPVPANDRTIRPKGYIAEALGKEDAVERATQRATLAASYTTRDHDVIRAWAETRGGRPADVTGTGRRGRGGAGVLRIEFPDGPGDDSRLSDVDWSTFFSTFDTSDVDFLYQERVRTGDVSRFHKLVRADS